MRQTPLRNLKPQLFDNEYETDSDDADSGGRSFSQLANFGDA